MIFGIGTDIVSYPRMLALHARHGDRFARRVLSEAELQEYTVHPQQARLLMKRFAIKEAFAKAVGTGLRHPVSMRELTVGHDELGKPVLEFSPVLTSYLEQLNIGQCHVSVSDEREHAVAFVVIEQIDH